MLQFRKPELSDKLWTEKFLNDKTNQNCELCFGNLFMWANVYHNLIINYNEMFIVKNKFEHINEYSVPLGKGNFLDALNFIIDDSKADDKICKITGASNIQISKIKDAMPGKFHFVPERDFFDYVYLVERLSGLSGKKLHSKRNHISNFKKMNSQWSYEKIDETNIKDCIEMHKKWIEINASEENKDEYEKEFLVASVGFENYFELGFSGGIIRLNGEVIAFTFGEKINDEVFCTHFEKAYSTIRGAYPFINQLFAQNNLAGYKYVNREEDMGLESLRKSKMSYRPDILLEKSIGIYRG